MTKCQCHLQGITSVFSSKRLVCTLHILEKEISLLWPRKGFVLFLLNVGDNRDNRDNRDKKAADRIEK